MDPSSTSSAKLHSWKISMQAKSKLFDVKLNASNLFPNLGTGGERISLLRLRRFLVLKVKSENRNLKAPRSRLFRFVGSSFGRKRRRIDPVKRYRHQNQGPMAAIAGSFSLLSHSTSEKNLERIIVHALFLIFYLIFFFKTRKMNLPLLLVATSISFIGFSLSCLSYTCTDLVTNIIWMAWNNIISIGCLNALSQVLFTRSSLLVKRNLMAFLIILALLSFILRELSREMIFRCIKCAIEGAPILISILLLPCQAFFHTLGDLKDPGVLGLYVSSTYFWGKQLIKFLAYCATAILH